MNAKSYVEILEKTLIPSAERLYPDGEYYFIQDNDPKHTSKAAREFFDQNGINWFKTPPESPDLNPIENVWHELKEYIRRVTKPKSKEELIHGIAEFWKTVGKVKCRKYIGHIHKVIEKVIEVQGQATGY